MKKFKRLIAIVTVLLFALTLVAPAFAQDESTTNPVYDDAAKVLKDKGVMQGNENGDLMLDKTLTRAEVVTMILRATGQEDVAEEYADAEASFSDTADHWAKKYIEAAKELGIVNGYPDGTFKPEAPIKFEELCKLLVAAANETPAAGKWPINYVKKALDLGFFNGIEDEVGIGDLVVRGQAAVGFAAAFFPPEKPAPVVKDVQPGDNTSFTVTLEAYAGYTLEDGDVTAADFEVKDAADETKTLAVKDATLDVATGKVTVKTDAQVAGKTYKVFFRGQDTTKTFAGVAVPLTVTKVEALNYKEIKVTFNRAVDDATAATTTGNYTVKFGTATITVSNVALAADKLSAILTLANTFSKDEVVTLVVGKAVGLSADYTATITNFIDTSAPTVVDVSGIGLMKAKVTFSEPVVGADIPSNYLVDGLYLVTNASVDATGRVVTLTFANTLAAGDHTVTFNNSNIKDYSAYGLVTPVKTFSLVADNTAIAVPTVVSATQTSVQLKFNKPIVDVPSVSINPGTPTYSGFSIDANDSTLVTLNFGSTIQTALPVSGAALTVSVKDATGLTGSVTVTVTPTVDLTRPTLSGVSVDSQSQLTLTFSENVKLPSSSEYGNFKLIASDNSYVTPSSITYGDSNAKLVLVFANRDPGTYTLSISGVKDDTPLANEIIPVTTSVSVADKVAPTVSNVVYQLSGSQVQKLYITFNEAVTASSAINPANYTFVYPTSTTSLSSISAAYLKLLPDGKTVLIDLSNSLQNKPTSIILSNIADLAGNTLSGVVAGTLNEVQVGTITLSSPALTATNTITLSTGTRDLITVSPYDFVVTYNAGNNKIYPISASYSSNTITLTLPVSLNTDRTMTYNNVVYTDVYVQTNNVALQSQDAFGNKIAPLSATPLADKVAPTVSVATGDASGEIKVTFSEQLSADPSPYIHVFDGSSEVTTIIKSVTANQTVVIKGSDSDHLLTSGKSYKITFDVSNIKDLSNNVMGYIDPVTVNAK